MKIFKKLNNSEEGKVEVLKSLLHSQHLEKQKELVQCELHLDQRLNSFNEIYNEFYLHVLNLYYSYSVFK